MGRLFRRGSRRRVPGTPSPNDALFRYVIREGGTAACSLKSCQKVFCETAPVPLATPPGAFLRPRCFRARNSSDEATRYNNLARNLAVPRLICIRANVRYPRPGWSTRGRSLPILRERGLIAGPVGRAGPASAPRNRAGEKSYYVFLRVVRD